MPGSSATTATPTASTSGRRDQAPSPAKTWHGQGGDAVGRARRAGHLAQMRSSSAQGGVARWSRQQDLAGPADQLHRGFRSWSVATHPPWTQPGRRTPDEGP
jgi:hypothetical protein